MKKKLVIGQRSAGGLGKRSVSGQRSAMAWARRRKRRQRFGVIKRGTKVLLFEKEIPGYAGLGEKLC